VSETRDSNSILRLRVELAGIEPPIWRRFEVREGDSLPRLHRTLQDVMGWWDSHLHEFEIKAIHFAEPVGPDFPSALDSRRVALADLELEPGETFTYVYDFGDWWLHILTVEATESPTKGVAYPRCLEGERRCPPEDCGSVDGYREMLRILADPTDEEHESMRGWVGQGWDPEEFRVLDVNDFLPALPTLAKLPRGGSKSVPELPLLSAEWELLKYCMARQSYKAFEKGEIAYFEVQRRGNALSLIHLVEGRRKTPPLVPVPVARFRFEPDSGGWHYDRPAPFRKGWVKDESIPPQPDFTSVVQRAAKAWTTLAHHAAERHARQERGMRRRRS
jgi:Plasmid pRiA4b ORF-3-like protein